MRFRLNTHFSQLQPQGRHLQFGQKRLALEDNKEMYSTQERVMEEKVFWMIRRDQIQHNYWPVTQ